MTDSERFTQAYREKYQNADGSGLLSTDQRQAMRKAETEAVEKAEAVSAGMVATQENPWTRMLTSGNLSSDNYKPGSVKHKQVKNWETQEKAWNKKHVLEVAAQAEATRVYNLPENRIIREALDALGGPTNAVEAEQFITMRAAVDAHLPATFWAIAGPINNQRTAELEAKVEEASATLADAKHEHTGSMADAARQRLAKLEQDAQRRQFEPEVKPGDTDQGTGGPPLPPAPRGDS